MKYLKVSNSFISFTDASYCLVYAHLATLYISADNEIDGEAFLDLSIEELNSLIPNKLGVVKKIYRLIQSVSA